jgi:hypothetical protein
MRFCQVKNLSIPFFYFGCEAHGFTDLRHKSFVLRVVKIWWWHGDSREPVEIQIDTKDQPKDDLD